MKQILTKEGVVDATGQFIHFPDGTYIDLVPTLDKPSFDLKAGDRVKINIEVGWG